MVRPKFSCLLLPCMVLAVCLSILSNKGPLFASPASQYSSMLFHSAQTSFVWAAEGDEDEPPPIEMTPYVKALGDIQQQLEDIDSLQRKIPQFPKLISEQQKLVTKLEKKKEPSKEDKASLTKEQQKLTDLVDEEKKAPQKLKDLIQKTTDDLRVAMGKVSDKDKQMFVHTGMMIQSYLFTLQDRYYESIILGKYLANHVPAKGEPEHVRIGLDAANIASNAARRAYAEAPPENRSMEKDILKEVSQTVIRRFPKTLLADNARMTLGGIYRLEDNYYDAVETFKTVPETSASFKDAQLQAGQLLWIIARETERHPKLSTDKTKRKAELKKMRDQARDYLIKGIEVIQDEDPLPPLEKNKSGESLIFAKISLSQLSIFNQQYDEAIAVLTREPYSVLKAIDVPNESQRPEGGNSLTRKSIASLVYRSLLRCYVGIGASEKAIETMDMLQKIFGDSKADELTAIYLDLGKKLKLELEQVDDEEEKQIIRESFESILEDLSRRKQGLTYSSMLWIATTYKTFGEDAENQDVANDYFDKAAETYQQILQMNADNRIKVRSPLGIQLEQARCKKSARKFDDALNILAEIIAKKESTIQAQMEAAYTMKERAQVDASNGGEWYTFALDGKEVSVGERKAKFWGWSNLAIRLQRSLAARNESASSTSLWGWMDIALGNNYERNKHSTATKSAAVLAFEEKFYESWYQLGLCRLEYAKLQKPDEQSVELGTGILQLTNLARILVDIPPKWGYKFNALYQELMEQLAVVDAEKQKNLGAVDKKIFEVPDTSTTTSETETTENSQSQPAGNSSES